MGQEKSLPSRCNSASISHHSSAASSTSLNSTKSLTPSRSPSTASSSVSSTASYKSIEQQTKYLNEHLYIKSYLEIDKEHIVKSQLFNQIRPGIRNYKPKILKDKLIQEELDVWI
jgi:choline dehydrogenase